MKKAAFALNSYVFSEVNIKLEKRTPSKINIHFSPSGRFISDDSAYQLLFSVQASSENQEEPFVSIRCKAEFKFVEDISFEDIPSYFYRNCIALLFPYVRAFISTVTLQANTEPIILPTMNLSSLEEPLRENTVQE